jgi:hypothetical protein
VAWVPRDPAERASSRAAALGDVPTQHIGPAFDAWLEAV